MLSYRHAFHAGNHADVLKHTVIQQIVTYLQRKPAPIWIIDTHAGAGLYHLSSAESQKCREWEGGVHLLWDRRDLVAPLTDYLARVKAINTDGELRLYPGSPVICGDLLRENDRLRLFELQSKEVGCLRELFKMSKSRQVVVSQSNGFNGVNALLPPPSRRGIVILDPSYETAADYHSVVQAVKGGLKKFSSGVFVVWYPQLSRRESKLLPEQLRKISPKWLDMSLSVKAPATGYGMHGSGMFVANPPWELKKVMQPALEQLSALLAISEEACFTLESSE